MNVISTFAKKLPPEAGASLVQQLRAAVVSSVVDRPLLRLRILTNVYHGFDRSAPSRYEAFIAIIKFAADSGNAELVIPKLKQVDQLLVEWGANIEQTRRIYKLAHNILSANNKSSQAHEFAIKYLQTFNTDIKEGRKVGDDVIETAGAVAREAISSDEIYQCDHLFSLEVVKLLETIPQYSLLYKLLHIFAQEKLDSFLNFLQSHPDFLQSAGLTEAHCSRKMRLLSLASLGAESNEVPYALVAQTLQISEDEVELWIIDAVSAKLLEAKLNQVKRVANVSFCVQRVFTDALWKQLSIKLNKWKSSIHHIHQTVQQTKHIGKKAAPSQSQLTVA